MRVACTAFVAVLVAASSVLANPARDIERVREAYYDARYKRAARIGARIAGMDEAAANQKIEALKFAAYAEFLLGNRDAATDHWKRLLNLNPSLRADPMEVSPELVEFFGAVPPPEPQPTEAAQDEGAVAEPPARVEAPPAKPGRGCGTWMCAIPFGVGQLGNGNFIKAGIFASAELAFLATNIGLYWKNRTEFERAGYFPDEDAAQRRHTFQLVFAGLLVATAIGGVVDAFLLP